MKFPFYSILFYSIPGVQIEGTVQRKAEEKKRWGQGEKHPPPLPPNPHFSDPEGGLTTRACPRDSHYSLEKQAGV